MNGNRGKGLPGKNRRRARGRKNVAARGIGPAEIKRFAHRPVDERPGKRDVFPRDAIEINGDVDRGCRIRRRRIAHGKIQKIVINHEALGGGLAGGEYAFAVGVTVAAPGAALF